MLKKTHFLHLVVNNSGFSTRRDCEKFASVSSHVSPTLHRPVVGQTWFMPAMQTGSVIGVFSVNYKFTISV